MENAPKRAFSEFALDADLLAGLEKMGYTHATPVQAEAIPAVLSGKDLMVQARTGTGKTLAFGLPTLSRIERTSPDTQILVITPTRELAVQVSEELSRVAVAFQIIVAAVYGGVKLVEQIDAMQWAPVVVGTPGRLRDHIERGYLHLDTCRAVVLDEADEMLDMGFKDDLEFILKRVPADKRQTLLFSATFPPEIVKIAQRYMRDPERIEVSSGFTPAAGLAHKFLKTSKDQKISTLQKLLTLPDVSSAIVFCATKAEAQWVYNRVRLGGFKVGMLTGDVSQDKRLETLDAFRDGSINILVATDVAARGLDIPSVSHVFHFNVPQDAATYIHRSGRTARAGRSGIVFTLVTPEDERDYQRILRELESAAGGGRETREGREEPRRQQPKAPAVPAREERQPQRQEQGRARQEERPVRTDERANGQNQQREPRREFALPRRGWEHRPPRLSAEQAQAAETIVQAIAQAGTTPDFQALAEAICCRRDASRMVAWLLAQQPLASSWLQLPEPAARPEPAPVVEEKAAESQAQAPRTGRMRSTRRAGSASVPTGIEETPVAEVAVAGNETPIIEQAPPVSETPVVVESTTLDETAAVEVLSSERPVPSETVLDAAPSKAPRKRPSKPKTAKSETPEPGSEEPPAAKSPVKRGKTAKAGAKSVEAVEADASEAAAESATPKKTASRAKKAVAVIS